MKLLSSISAVLVLGLLSGQAEAGSAIDYQTNSTISYVEQKISTSIMSPEMIDQVTNKGCVPRGELILDSKFDIGLSLVGISTKGSSLKAQVHVCNDALVPSFDARTSIGLRVRFDQYKNQAFTKRSLPKVSLKSPSGVQLYLWEQCVTNWGSKICTYRSVDLERSYQWFHKALETGAYELTIENPGVSDVAQEIYLYASGLQAK